MALSKEEKRAVLDRFSAEVWSKGDMATADELIDPELLDHNPFPGMPGKREGFKQTVQVFRTAMPDLTVTPLNFIVDGDKVMDHWEGTATNTASLAGIPASGKAMRLSGIGIARIGDDDTIVERWAQFNLLEIMQQLGVVPGGGGWPQWGSVPEVSPGRDSTPEDNKAVFNRHIEEIWNQGKLDVADELFHPHSVTPYATQLPPGPEGCKVIAKMFREAFPDFHVVVEDIIAENDLVAARLRQSGTHQGEFFGIPPTGKQVDFEEMALVRFVDAKMFVTWFETDLMTMMQQLGVGQPA